MDETPLDRMRNCERELAQTREREQRYWRMFDAMNAGLGLAEIVLDVKGSLCDFRLRDVNDALGRILGFSAEQAIGRTSRDLIPAVASNWFDVFARVARSGVPEWFESSIGVLGKRFDIFVYQPTPEQFAFLAIDIIRRKGAEKAPIDQLNLAEAVFTHSINALAVLDRNYNFLRVNEAYARGTRRNAADFRGRNLFEIYPSDAKPIFDEVVRTKPPFATFTRAVAFPDQPKRGITYWDWTLVPVFDSAGEIECLVLNLVDVTERKRAEEALRESEARHRRQAAELETIYRTAPVGLCVLDTQLRYVHINERLAELNGFPADAHLGKSVREMVPAAADIIEHRLRRVLETGEPDREFAGSTDAPPGVRRDFVSQFWPLKGDDGGVVGVNLVVEEVTERRRLEETRRREQEFRSLAENSTDVVSRWDRARRRVYVNPAIEALLGRPRAEVVGKTSRELGLPREPSEQTDNKIEQVFATGKMQTLEITMQTPRGLRVLDSRFVPEFGTGGKVETVLAITRDITERKRAENALKAYAEGQDFLATTALRLLQPMERHELFAFVTEQIYSVADGSVVSFTEFEPVDRRLTIQTLRASPQELGAIHRLLGRDLVGLDQDFPASYLAQVPPGQFVRLAGGICDLVFSKFPKALCNALEHELGVRHVYLLPFSVERDLLGSVALLVKGEELPNQRLIETVVTDTALALRRKRVEEALQNERNFVDKVLDTQGAVVAVLDRHYRIVRLNRAYYAIAGFPIGSKTGRTFSDLMDAASADTVVRQLDILVDQQTTGEFESQISVHDRSTRYVSWRTTAQRSDTGEVEYVIATGIDITERIRMEERTRHLAEHDALTDLPNRRLLLELLDAARQLALRGKNKVAVLFLDLDRFKIINDTLGHDVGDTLLKEVARRLAGRVRRSDVVARLGGDEFAVLLSELTRGEQAADVARELLLTFRRPFRLADQSLYVTASVGISLFPDDSDTTDGLLRRADLAMYEAKEQGRDTFRFYNPVVDRRARERARIENSLRQALERDELRVVYQPEIELRSGRVAGVEALIRWHHPELGVLDPARFIPLAEETGLITLLDDWVLRHVCLQARQWLDQDNAISVAVNVSAKRFESPVLVEAVRRHLADSGLPPEYLELELTEHTVMRRIDQSVERMRELVALGVAITIDDFGTGYSSLSYLKQLPIAKLKIDQSFVRDIAFDADDRAIIQAVTALAHTLNKRVCAEGVETQIQRAFLAKTGCDEAQGFFFTKPLSSERLAQFLVRDT